MKKNELTLREKMRGEFEKYNFKPNYFTEAVIKSYYCNDKELAYLQRLLFEFNLLKNKVRSLAKEYCELGYELEEK